MALYNYRRSRSKDAASASAAGFRRLLLLAFPLLLAVLMLFIFVRSRTDLYRSSSPSGPLGGGDEPSEVDRVLLPDPSFVPKLPAQTPLSLSLEQRNNLPPRNADLFPAPPRDRIPIVLYVHNRPHYLRAVVRSLSSVEGIGETLLIVSHDGYFPEMDDVVQSIKFCRVKQIFAPYSPHLFPDSFPGTSPSDCRDKDVPSAARNCSGTADQYGNHRSPRIVSLKHHWWWMMNTLWDGLAETKDYSGHILFIEEDHFIYPNAYRNLQMLVALKPRKCSDCYAVNLAPSDVNFKGEGWNSLIAEKIGNVGYAFNRTVWRRIHAKAKEFCSFDEYNWDITMWATVYPSLGTPVYTLRGPRRSAAHFGKCGLHQGQGRDNACIDNGEANVQLDEADKVPNIDPEWPVQVIKKQSGYQAGFKGWGGWGDDRDRDLCLTFSYMYHTVPHK